LIKFGAGAGQREWRGGSLKMNLQKYSMPLLKTSKGNKEPQKTIIKYFRLQEECKKAETENDLTKIALGCGQGVGLVNGILPVLPFFFLFCVTLHKLKNKLK
jgi:hypothetical protein